MRRQLLGFSLRSYASQSQGQSIISQLRPTAKVSQDEKSRLQNAYTWHVIEIDQHGKVKETEETPETLRLEPRDVALFSARPQGQLNERATIVARDQAIFVRTGVWRCPLESHKLHFKMGSLSAEVVRMVIQETRAILFPSRREKDTVRMAQSLVDQIRARSPWGIGAPPGSRPGLPFELRCLEAVLAETQLSFAQRHRRLALLSSTVVGGHFSPLSPLHCFFWSDSNKAKSRWRPALLSSTVEDEVSRTITSDPSDLQRLLPIQRALAELNQDVKETRGAIQAIVENEHDLAAVCLSEGRGSSGGYPKASPATLRVAGVLLDSYERQIESIENALKELGENLDVTREVWGMTLSATRNRIVRINLLVSIAGLSLTTTLVVPTLFGMNLPHGLEEHPYIFWPICYWSGVLGTSFFGAIYAYWKYAPNKRHARRVEDLKALRELLHFHNDDLEEVLTNLVKQFGDKRGQPITRKEFFKFVRGTLCHRRVADGELDLLHRVFDLNKNGLLDSGELARTRLWLGAQDQQVPFPPSESPIPRSPFSGSTAGVAAQPKGV